MKIKIGKISYINTFPVYFEFKEKKYESWLETICDVPKVLNTKLKDAKIVLSPVSSFAYAANFKDWLIIPNLSISSYKQVMSVLLVSNHKIEDLDNKKCILSSESESAVNLLKIFLKEKSVSVKFEIGNLKEKEDIIGEDSALLIGDFALSADWGKHFKYVYDMSQLWYEKHKYPFVFAVWAARRDFAEKEPDKLREIANILLESKEKGKAKIDEIILFAKKRMTNMSKKDLAKYYSCLNCDLSGEHVKSLRLYYDKLFEHKLINHKVEIDFFK